MVATSDNYSCQNAIESGIVDGLAVIRLWKPTMQLSSVRRALVASIRQSWKGMVIGGLLAAPVAMYIRVFGFTISSRHGVWAEMGSAMSGIYGPILSILTLVVLIMQVRLQRQTNNHTHEQAFLQNAKADIDFYLGQLPKVLDRQYIEPTTVRDVLHSWYKDAAVEQLSGDELRRAARVLESNHPQVQAIWMAIYPIFTGLGSNTNDQFALHFASARHKTIAMLSYPTCVALDHYLFCLTEGRVRFAYLFTNVLPGRRH